MPKPSLCSGRTARRSRPRPTMSGARVRNARRWPGSRPCASGATPAGRDGGDRCPASPYARSTPLTRQPLVWRLPERSRVGAWSNHDGNRHVQASVARLPCRADSHLRDPARRILTPPPAAASAIGAAPLCEQSPPVSRQYSCSAAGASPMLIARPRFRCEQFCSDFAPPTRLRCAIPTAFADALREVRP
jgi:hypothetical protein